ncbi:MAG TPA: N-acetylglucosamine-6-phosphate deacetylase [Candidatus Ornithospirochaeta avicola]|uniref:N-acetylglucosamine-6-phosphate deacetylase n=1 Tax=Candidatus Ornithospirochaeta avicola TaxID=2840896 RepID=A0A9D1TMM9_9SPIO|nr:N-acetylglucosamine-6-phosphate deacetylase [Candidatus Ornithospirochaeta avicola]
MREILKGLTVYTKTGKSLFDITIDGGVISDIKNSEESCGTVVLPGFIDTHIHGFGGYGTEDCSAESILKMSENLIRFGITSFFPTIYTDTEEKMIRSIRAVSEAKGKEKGAEIAGIHIEGPFISPDKIGAQNPLGRKDPSAEWFLKYLEAGGGLVKAMTIAPELPGIEEVALEAKKQGVVLLMGHTNCKYAEAIHGYNSGITHATHLFNAMRGLSHREPGTVGAVLTTDMTCEIIADGLHVNQQLTKYIFDTKTSDKVCIITDSLKPTEQEEGPFYANDVEVEIDNGLWVTKGRPELIQGSSLTMYKGFMNALNWGCSVYDASKMTSTTPARIYDLKNRGKIEIGYKADLVLLDEKTMQIKRVMF